MTKRPPAAMLSRAPPVQRDDQESRATLDVLPGYSFTPDSRAVVVSYGGEIWRVALNDGAEFGRGGDGFVRLNFACPRRRLTEALERMREALRAKRFLY